MQSKKVWFSDRDYGDREGVSRVTIWRNSKLGFLPKPHKTGPNTTRWHIDDIEENDRKRRGRVAA